MNVTFADDTCKLKASAGAKTARKFREGTSMKKLLAILLATTMLLMAIPAFAKGDTTDKPITFAEFNFGDTFGTIRSNQYLRNINFQRGIFSPRHLADVTSFYLGDWSRVSETSPTCFYSDTEGGRKVAGHDCEASLWFVYPVENGACVVDESSATFYAGEYRFFDDKAKATFDDLKKKLTQLYGKPYSEDDSLDDALGEITVSEDHLKEAYKEQQQRYDAKYVVWKSSANNAALVLKIYKQDGDREWTKLTYVSLDAADTFAQIEVSGDVGGGSDSMAGL